MSSVNSRDDNALLKLINTNLLLCLTIFLVKIIAFIISFVLIVIKTIKKKENNPQQLHFSDDEMAGI